MSIETALRARIKAAAGVSAITTNVEWVKRPQGSAYPAVVLQVITDPRPQHMKGFQELRATRVQIDVFATTAPVKAALREAVIAAIAPSGTFSGLRFERAFIEDIRDLSEGTDTTFIHRDSIDAMFWTAT